MIFRSCHKKIAFTEIGRRLNRDAISVTIEVLTLNEVDCNTLLKRKHGFCGLNIRVSLEKKPPVKAGGKILLGVTRFAQGLACCCK
jgi:hypothetical protein